MATRGAIVRITDLDKGHFSGRYHHWDSYPGGLGAELFALFHGYFEKNLDRMLAFLIDQHPAGWSTIQDADFNVPAGTQGGPTCYCHSRNGETPHEVTHENASGSGCEYVYGFTPDCKMHILSSYRENGAKMIGMFGVGDPNAVWKPIAVVDLHDEEPDWKNLRE